MGVGFDPFTPRPQELRGGFDVRQNDQVVDANVVEEIVPGNVNRVTLIFQVHGGNAITLAPVELEGTSGGIILPADSDVLVVNFKDWGPLVGEPWFAIAAGALNRLKWIEVSWRGVDRR